MAFCSHFFISAHFFSKYFDIFCPKTKYQTMVTASTAQKRQQAQKTNVFPTKPSSQQRQIDRQPNQYHSKLCFNVYQTIATANALNGRPQNNLSSKEWAKFGVGVWFDYCFGVYLLGKGSNTVLGSTHVVEQLSFFMFSSILTFDFYLFWGNFF